LLLFLSLKIKDPVKHHDSLQSQPCTRARAGEHAMRTPESPLNAVLTGASSGIGRATALAFAKKGALLVLASRDRENLREVAQDCEEAGGAATIVATDVTDAAAVQSLADAALAGSGMWTSGSTTSAWVRSVSLMKRPCKPTAA
jgi:hypothetical protein